jgi:hypothetical protein
LQLGELYGLSPWSASGIGGWTWPQIWLAVIHEEDVAAALKVEREKGKRKSEGYVSFCEYAAKRRPGRNDE